ncbi:hypothetical protein FSP39_010220 [Pinctada imbricata]|uniref:Cytochrome P450 n=1 Tax=Pinctada imbricata TaxID=66713 RepID=A0AA88Y059_PINIB|nr:hypothetical protein FSP39_010220 [Pinctada imbricata]
MGHTHQTSVTIGGTSHTSETDGCAAHPSETNSRATHTIETNGGATHTSETNVGATHTSETNGGSTHTGETNGGATHTHTHQYSKWKHSYWRRVGVPGPEPVLFLGNLGTIKKKKRIDLMQIMLNSHKEAVDKDDTSNMVDYKETGAWKNRGLSIDEVTANAFQFLLAGYDTTANTLSFLAYNLAMNPECQEKCIEEVDRVLGQGKPDYDNMLKMQYLDNCTNETLRMYGPASRTHRVVEEDCELAGYIIPKGAAVEIAFYSIHHDPEFWPDPYKFNPDRYDKWKHSFWRRRGLEGPEPTPFLGNLGMIREKGIWGFHTDCRNRFGKVYGSYMGHVPEINVADPVLVKELLVKRFGSFPNRYSRVEPIDEQKGMVFFAKDDHWKYIRNTLTATFSSGKMRVTSPAISDCCDKLMDNIKEQSNDGKDIVEIKRKVVYSIMEDRKTGTTQRKDFMQIMMNSHNEAVDKEDKANMVDIKGNSSWKNRGFTIDEVTANAFLFFLAGYDTTANTLSFMAYNLAMYPECQEKCIAEVDRVLGQDKPNYDNVLKLQYLDNCMNETLRMYGPASATNREVLEDCEIAGYKVPKGCALNIPIFVIHHDPEYWPEPYKFDPDRFLPEEKEKRHPYAFLPFGHGPRNCIGMRLAYLEAKAAIASILRKYRFVRCSETEDPVVLDVKSNILRAKNGIKVKLESR